MTNELVLYDAARQALAKAHGVDEVKTIRDKALALATYARQAKDGELIAWATEIKVRAERRAGELLQATAVAGQRQTANRGRPKKASLTNEASSPTLADLGITHNQSSQWQKLADLTEREFEQRLKAVAPTDVTTARVLRPPSSPRRMTPTPRRRSAHLDQALEEALVWMRRWSHLGVLSPIFQAIRDFTSHTKEETKT